MNEINSHLLAPKVIPVMPPTCIEQRSSSVGVVIKTKISTEKRLTLDTQKYPVVVIKVGSGT